MLNKEQQSFNDLIFYQIYPKSFKDSDGDGIGDLKGITEKLDYLKDLGINAVWLSPCYKSPNEDNGYDISDYTDIMDEFGTLDDWKIMIKEMHKRGIKLIMDYVANHTSSEHKWFKESRKSKDNPYRDYYYWVDKPLNDWKSCFGGSAWEYDEATNQYYLHSFAKGQPDLNWSNPKVREEMKKVVDYWVDLGVDGFRCDVFDMIAKDFEKGLNGNAEKLHDYIREVFGREEVKHLFTVGECWGANEDNIKSRIDGERRELSTVFIMQPIVIGMEGDKFRPTIFSLDDVRNSMVQWQHIMQNNDLLGTIVLENHDRPRSVSYFGDDENYRYESATMLAAMTFLQKGVPFIFQGEEIGISDPKYKNIENYRDIETINYYNENSGKIPESELMERICNVSRDNSRRPMPWDDSKYSGFSDNEPWIDVYDTYKKINVEADKNNKNSVFNFYKKLISLRKENEEFKRGKYEDLTDGKNGMYIYRRSTATKSFIVVCNFSKKNLFVSDLKGNVVLSNLGRNELNGKYKPYECAVFEEIK